MDVTKTISSTGSLRSSTMDSLPMDRAFVTSAREQEENKWLSPLAPLLASTEQRLWALWEKHDFDDELRQRRQQKSEEIVTALLEDMVKQEELMGEKLAEQIRTGRRRVADLRAQLGLPAFNEAAYAPESVRLWRLLEAQSTSLAKQLEDMEARVPELERRVEEMRRRLGEERRAEEERRRETEEDKENARAASAASTASSRLLCLMEGLGGPEGGEAAGGGGAEKSPLEKEKERVSLAKRVSRLENRLHRLTRELEERKERVRVAQFECRERTQRIGDAVLASDVADVISMSIEAADSVLTKEHVERAEQAREVVAFRYREWAEREAFAYDELYLQLLELWEACHVSEHERTLPKRFLPEKHAHADVERARAEVARLERMREERAAIHEAVDKWIRLWNEKVHFELESEQRAETGVSKYANRAGSLMKAMKRSNQLEKVLLPGATMALQTACEEYEQRREDGDRCLMHGMTPLQYVEYIRAEHARDREERRAERLAARKAAIGGGGGAMGGGPSSTNLTKSPWMPSGRSASRLAPTAFSTTRLPTTPYAGGASTSRMPTAALSRVAASTSVLHGVRRSPLSIRAPTTPTALMQQTPSRSKFATPSALHHHHTPNASVLSGRVRKSLSKVNKRVSASSKKFFAPILSSLSPISAYGSGAGTKYGSSAASSSGRPTASPLSMTTSSSGVSSLRPPSSVAASPAPFQHRALSRVGGGGGGLGTPGGSRLPPPTVRTPLASSLGSLSRTPRFHL